MKLLMKTLNLKEIVYNNGNIEFTFCGALNSFQELSI